MRGLMGDLPLSLDRFLWRAQHLYAQVPLVTATGDGTRRTTFGSWADRVDLVGPALDALGVSGDGRVASFCWSTDEHLELYFGVPVSGRVLHPVNVRFSDEQLIRVVAQAQDEVVFAHTSVVGRLWSLLGSLPSVRHVVLVDDGGSPDDPPPGVSVHHYEELLASVRPSRGQVTDELQAAAIFNTTGSTGPPKGIVLSHRSIVLHTMSTLMRGWVGIDDRDVVLPVVPMFHANALSLTHASIASGASLVLPGSDLSGPAIAELFESERVTVTVGVPTHWTTTLPHLVGRDLSSMRLILCGSSVVPVRLSEAFEQTVGVGLTQGWGLSESSALTTLLPASDGEAKPDDLRQLRSTVGVPLPGVETRLVDDEGQVVPWDGATPGELQVRGPWVIAGYLGGEAPESTTADGWLRTGDVATIGPDGYIRIVDRLKDVIKSGGEWISSIAIEVAVLEHPHVADAAVIGAPHLRWGERPVLYVVPDGELDVDHLERSLTGRLESWWLPDEVVVTDQIPRSGNGKIDKLRLREQFRALVAERDDPESPWVQT